MSIWYVDICPTHMRYADVPPNASTIKIIWYHSYTYMVYKYRTSFNSECNRFDLSIASWPLSFDWDDDILARVDDGGGTGALDDDEVVRDLHLLPPQK